MIMRKKCSKTTFLCSSLALLFTINLILYFFVDEGHIFSLSPQVHINKVASQRSDEKDNKKTEVQPSRLKSSSNNRKLYPAKFSKSLIASQKAAKKIKAAVDSFRHKYSNRSTSFQNIYLDVMNDLRLIEPASPKLWSYADEWPTGLSIIPDRAPLLGSILNALCSSKIVKADNSKKGTQLKIALTLEGGRQALFKPQWYTREETISGPVYAGKDRHNAEVAAFHLSLLLGMRRVPLTVGRRLDLRREVLPVATTELHETFFQEGNNTCFYGVCMYCKPTDPVCARQDIMEGALILWLPSRLHFSRYAHPWQRSYRNNMAVRWEIEEDYCDKVKKLKQYSGPGYNKLLDLVETAIFDFLLSNGDRHHYEMPDKVAPNSVFLFDNGKSFGNASSDHIDILAPLYQCCILRNSTWKKLQAFRAGALSWSLERILRSSHIAPVLTKEHLQSLDRRLLLVFAAVELCLQEKGVESVLH